MQLNSEILRMGDSRLWRVAKPVEVFDTPTLHALVAHMFHVMDHAGGVGLAAPQIGVDLRVVVFGFEKNERYPDEAPVAPTVLINPVITPLSELQVEGWEGCLSVPGMRGEVPRYESIRYQGVDQYGQPIDRIVNGFHARVVQHECDHLDGILYPLRIKNMRHFGYSDILFPSLPVEIGRDSEPNHGTN